MKSENLWGQAVYVQFREEIDPFKDYQYFRPLNKAYNGENTFWSLPSPEPDLSDDFWEAVRFRINNEAIKAAACGLAYAVSHWEPDGKNLVFAAILRAGVPIADWLCQLIPGAAAVSLSLFAGLGPDRVALESLRQNYPERKIVFVDGWTGRGGVSRELAKLGAGPLAVLIDPWGWADFSGTQEDIFCPTACFTGAATLGFSRTFYVDDLSLFAAFRFPRKYCREELVRTWRMNCPEPGTVSAKAGFTHPAYFFKETSLRLHSNEVCRALINAAPETIYFLHDAAYVREHYPLLLLLADRRNVKIIYNVRELKSYRTRAACSLQNT